MGVQGRLWIPRVCKKKKKKKSHMMWIEVLELGPGSLRGGREMNGEAVLQNPALVHHCCVLEAWLEEGRNS